MTAHCYICVMGSDQSMQRFEHIGLNPVIAVYKSDIFACGTINAVIAGVRQAAVLFVDDLNPGVQLFITFADFAAIVRRAIVYKNQFEVSEGLCEDGIDTLA
ncbi:hypothetical protein D3C76_1437470 [compost metagenome]